MFKSVFFTYNSEKNCVLKYCLLLLKTENFIKCLRMSFKQKIQLKLSQRGMIMNSNKIGNGLSVKKKCQD